MGKGKRFLFCSKLTALLSIMGFEFNLIFGVNLPTKPIEVSIFQMFASGKFRKKSSIHKIFALQKHILCVNEGKIMV